MGRLERLRRATCSTARCSVLLMWSPANMRRIQPWRSTASARSNSSPRVSLGDRGSWSNRHGARPRVRVIWRGRRGSCSNRSRRWTWPISCQCCSRARQAAVWLTSGVIGYSLTGLEWFPSPVAGGGADGVGLSRPGRCASPGPRGRTGGWPPPVPRSRPGRCGCSRARWPRA